VQAVQGAQELKVLSGFHRYEGKLPSDFNGNYKDSEKTGRKMLKLYHIKEQNLAYWVFLGNIFF